MTDSLSQVLANSVDQEWLTLEDLSGAVLRHVVEADAHFQMLQRETWRRIAASFTPLERFQQLGGVSFTAGLDRLENLGLTQLDFEATFRVKRARWYARIWRRIRIALGRDVPAEDPRYRLAASARGRGCIQLRLVVSRGRDGQWSVDSSTLVSRTAAA